MRAVVVGPGRVGCGFAGEVLHRSGFRVDVVGRGRALGSLRDHGCYRVRLTDGRVVDERTVPVGEVADIGDRRATAGVVAGADLVAVSVGAAALPDVARAIAAGLAASPRPVTVVAYENTPSAGAVLRRELARWVGRSAVARHDVTGAVLARAVSQRLFPEEGSRPMLLVGEPVVDCVVDGAALSRPLPPVLGTTVSEDFVAAYRRKLFRYSTGHVITAYLGALKGYRYLHAAVRDPEIAHAVRAGMAEARAGLLGRYGEEVAGDEAELDAILVRFGNAALADTVARVGRDPRRKLRVDDRLVGPARLAQAHGVVPRVLARASAAALCFAPDGGPPLLPPAPFGVAALDDLLDEVCGLGPRDPLARRIRRCWLDLAGAGRTDNLMLSLELGMWTRVGTSADPTGATTERSRRASAATGVAS